MYFLFRKLYEIHLSSCSSDLRVYLVTGNAEALWLQEAVAACNNIKFIPRHAIGNIILQEELKDIAL